MKIRFFSVAFNQYADRPDTNLVEKRINDALTALENQDRYINYCRIYPEERFVLVYIAHTPMRRST